MTDRKPWDQYPKGTRAYHHQGGYWERVDAGWMWCTGATFPTPGAGVIRLVSPPRTKTGDR